MTVASTGVQGPFAVASGPALPACSATIAHVEQVFALSQNLLRILESSRSWPYYDRHNYGLKTVNEDPWSCQLRSLDEALGKIGGVAPLGEVVRAFGKEAAKEIVGLRYAYKAFTGPSGQDWQENETSRQQFVLALRRVVIEDLSRQQTPRTDR